MENSKIKFYGTFLLGLCINTANAQSGITSSGGNASGSGGSVSYSIGQMVYKTNNSSSGSVEQGVQQPHEILVVSGLEEANESYLNLSAFPNPSSDYFILRTESSTKNMSYQFFNNTGQLIENKEIIENDTKILINHLVPGPYFLKVIKANKEVKSFKIMKN